MAWENLGEDILEEFDGYQEGVQAQADAILFGYMRQSKRERCACGNERDEYHELCAVCTRVHRSRALAKYRENMAVGIQVQRYFPEGQLLLVEADIEAAARAYREKRRGKERHAVAVDRARSAQMGLFGVSL